MRSFYPKYQRATVQWDGGVADVIISFWMSDEAAIQRVKDRLGILCPRDAVYRVTSRISFHRGDDSLYRRYPGIFEA